ncbi:glycosyltransferase family 2 protein [Lelliottia nimipressuralis]
MLNIVIPMAGLGSRFAQAGFTDPKPLISVGGAPMIELVIRNLQPVSPHRFIFLCKQAHLDRYDITGRLHALAPGCEVRGLARQTEGAACTVLTAGELIDNEAPLLIANADQWVDMDIHDFLVAAARPRTDGLIMTMRSRDAKWSYVQRDAQGHVCGVVEKVPVSDEATTGIYYFAHGADFCRAARAMIDDDERSHGEFYVAPVYTRLYQEGLHNIATFSVDEGMHGLGTPDDLAAFLEHPALDKALGCGKVAA